MLKLPLMFRDQAMDDSVNNKSDIVKAVIRIIKDGEKDGEQDCLLKILGFL